MLSMYDDDDMDDAEEHGNQENHGGGDASVLDVDATAAVDSGNDDNATSGLDDERSCYVSRASGDSRDKTPQGTLQISEASQSDAMNGTVLESDGRNTTEAVAEDKKVDPLDIFLPPPLKLKCSEELQRRIQKFLELKRAGKSFNEEVRKKKDYRNPDFLLHAVRYNHGCYSLPPAADIIPQDGRQNKKTKWDKIDGTHATLLSSANAGGYTLGHQKQREVEEKRSSERKLDRRS
ncbi:hypothetical protein ACLB2K_021763 [Fragaria x ananassa]